jgi:hypothetical protein
MFTFDYLSLAVLPLIFSPHAEGSSWRITWTRLVYLFSEGALIMAQPNKQGKTMSSRLLTMKFMQRSAASPASSPSTPSEPPSKRQRLSNGSHVSILSSTPQSDVQAVEEALAAEEQRRTEALEREAADRGETKWYFSFKEQQTTVQESPLRIVSAGFSMLDATRPTVDGFSEEDVDVDISTAKGRRSFGKFNRSLEVCYDNN